MKNDHHESLQRLRHIEKAILSIETYATGQTLASFCDNALLQDAVLMQFIIIGEAIGHVEYEKLDKYNYAWYKVRSFRNMIAHEYFNIKMPAVWQIVITDLPDLKQVIEKMLVCEF